MKIRIDTTQARGCAKLGCYSPPPYFRHHKGNDAHLGSYVKKLRDEYMQFKRCTRICDECHMTIHYIYNGIMAEWKDWTPKGVMKLREKLIRKCDRWLKSDKKLTVPKTFQDTWRASKKLWELQQTNPTRYRKVRARQARRRKNR